MDLDRHEAYASRDDRSRHCERSEVDLWADNKNCHCERSEAIQEYKIKTAIQKSK